MKTIISYLSQPEHYKADALVVWCFDDRFSDLLEHFKKERGFRHLDVIKIAGGAKDLTIKSKESDYLLKQIEKSIKLHHPSEIILMVHADCGAYDKKFNNEEEEKIFYTHELQKAAATVQNFLNQLNKKIPIVKYFASFQGLEEI